MDTLKIFLEFVENSMFCGAAAAPKNFANDDKSQRKKRKK